MITIEQNDNLLNVGVLGEFTLADFKQFEESALYKLKSPGEVNLLFDLRDMVSYTLDVAWEKSNFSAGSISTISARSQWSPTTNG